MTVTVKLITEQTTNLLVDSVNKAQADGWYPVCGVVYFNARYTQLIAHDSNGTEVPKCNYFLVDSEDGIDFANRVNKLVALNTGASCLSSVQYVNARYIQAWGDDTLHHGGGGSGGNALKWYTEDAAKTYPIIDVDPNFSQIGLGNEWAGYVQLLFRTGGNNAGYILADDGTFLIHKSDNAELILEDDRFTVGNRYDSQLNLGPDVSLRASGRTVLMSNGESVNLNGVASNLSLTTDRVAMGNNAGNLAITQNSFGEQFNVSLDDMSEFNLGGDGIRINQKGVNVFASSEGYTNVIGEGSALSLGPNFASVGSPGGSLELDVDRGILLYGNGGVNMVIDANETMAMFGSNVIPSTLNGKAVTVNGDSILLNGALGSGSVEVDADAVRIKRGTNNLFSISNSGGAMTWNSVIRCAWDANGWNVSHDTGVAFSSRATYSMMQAKSGARVETNATGTSIVSSDSTSLQSTINLTNTSIVSKKGATVDTLDATGFTRDTDGEHIYMVDGSHVFFSSGDITKINALDTYIVCDNGAGINIHTIDQMPVTVSGGPLAPSSTETLGTPATPWSHVYTSTTTPTVVQTATASVNPTDDVIAKMANLTPKGIVTSGLYTTMGYMYEDVILAFGVDDAQIYGLAWMEDGRKIVNPVSILAMEALYVRSRLP